MPKFSKLGVLLFVVGFGLAGAYLLGRNFAAPNTILSLQAESLTGSGTVISDTSAHQDKALKLTNATPATGSFTIAEKSYKLLVRARGTACNGAPKIVINIDGQQKLSDVVSSTTWDLYITNIDVAAGTHKISAVFTNPDSDPACNRVLYLDTIWIEKNPASTTTTPPPTPTPTASPSGQAMPVGDLPGWTQVFTEDFLRDAPLGDFATVYGTRWRTYSGADTSGKIYPSKKSEYNTAKVVSVNGGVLDKFLHTEYDANGYNGDGNYMMSAALLPRLTDQLYGRYTVRLKAGAVNGYKVAWLLWPASGNWPHDGEIDFAETDLTGTLKAFIHRQGATAGSDQTACSTAPGMSLSSGWHTVTLEWAPTTKIFVDGVLECQSSDRIPNTPMHLVLQTESELFSPASTNQGHLQLDWVAMYAKQ